MISEFPLFLFTLLAGLSAGFCAVRALVPVAGWQGRRWTVPAAALALLGLGLVCVWFHLGRMERVLNAMANPQAGICQEAYCAIVLGVLLLIELVMEVRGRKAPRGLPIASGVVALVLAVVMGFAYVGNYAVPAWTDWSTVPLYAVADVAMGAALVGLFEPARYEKPALLATSVVAQVLVMLTFVLMGMHFAHVGRSTVPFAAAAVLAGAVPFALTMVARKKPSAELAAAMLACSVIGVAVARYAFYAASIL